MEEIIAAAITTIDLFVIYLLLNVKERRVVLVLWTTFLNIAFPFIGYYIGQWSSHFFYEWTTLLSGFLLCLIGVHMLLEKEEDFQMRSEEHTSELQSRFDLVCRLLLE